MNLTEIDILNTYFRLLIDFENLEYSISLNFYFLE